MGRQKNIFSPNARDLEILNYVADYRFLSVELLTALLAELPQAGKKYGFSEAAIRARCQKLRKHSYLAWQFLHDLPTGRSYHTEKPAIYSIGSEILSLSEAEFGFSPELLKQSLEKNQLSSMFLRHFLMISRFRTCLELACRSTEGRSEAQTGVTVELGTWLQDGLVDRVQVKLDETTKMIPVVPDAFFNLILHKPDGSVAVSHYALEADRGTMPSRSITAKAAGYAEYIRQGLQKRRYTYYGEDGPSQELRVVNPKLLWKAIPPKEQQEIVKYGVESFTVLFVTRGVSQDIECLRNLQKPTRERQQNLIEAVKRVDGLDPSKMRFLFCTEYLDYNLMRPNAVLDSIWNDIVNSAANFLLSI